VSLIALEESMLKALDLFLVDRVRLMEVGAFPDENVGFNRRAAKRRASSREHSTSKFDYDRSSLRGLHLTLPMELETLSIFAYRPLRSGQKAKSSRITREVYIDMLHPFTSIYFDKVFSLSK
jgi:hypothetical protein